MLNPRTGSTDLLTALTHEKTALRQGLRRKRMKLSPETKKRFSLKACRRLYRYIKRSAKIGIYHATGSEMSLQAFYLKAKSRGATIYFPYIEKRQKRLWFTPFNPQHRARNHVFNIPQFEGEKRRAHRLNLLIVPLIGIDQNGRRLGQGGGFYDATIGALQHRLHPKIIGAGFACQMVDALPFEAHDMALPMFVSEAALHVFKPPNTTCR